MKKILFFSLVAASLTACSTDDIEVPATAAPAATKITIAAEQAAARTELQPDGKTVTWAAGDRIAVYCEYLGTNPGAKAQHVERTQKIFTLQESSAGKSIGIFDGEINFAGFDESAEASGGEGGKYRYHAYYPVNDSYKGLKGAVEQTLSPIQSFDAAAETYDLSKNDLLIGRYLEGTRDNLNIPIPFTRVFAMMQFNVANATDEPFRLQKIEMIAEEGKALTGSYKIAINASSYIVSGQLAPASQPTFTAGNNTLTVEVDNGIVANGETLNVKSIFNRWENLEGTTVTLRVTTSKGVYETSFDGKDYSAYDNWRKTVTVDNLTPAAEEIVDNYVEGAMTLATSSTIGTASQWSKAGVFCISEDITYNNTCQVACPGDITLIGRYTSATTKEPKVKLTSTVTFAKNLPENVNVTLKNLILSPKCETSTNATFLRFNNTACAVESLTIDNCIIELPENPVSSTNPILPLCGAGHGIKRVVIKNSVFRNISTSNRAIVGIITSGATDIESVVFENNTIYNTQEITLEQSMFVIVECPDVTLRNNTIYNYAGNETAALVKVSSGALVWKDNIVATSAASGAFVFSSLNNVTAEGNIYDNCAEVNGGDVQTVGNLFRDAAAGDFSVVSSEVPTGCGDQRWW